MSEQQKQDYLLASMRVASLNLKSWAAEIDIIGLALRDNVLTLEQACADLNAMGVLHWMPTPQPLAEAA